MATWDGAGESWRRPCMGRQTRFCQRDHVHFQFQENRLMKNNYSKYRTHYSRYGARSSCSEANVENRLTASSQRVDRRFISCASISSSSCSMDQDRNPYSTHLNRPPAAYCVNDSRCSPALIGTFPCMSVAEGIRARHPGGNWTRSLSCRNTKCPPFVGSKVPVQKIGHRPFALLPESVCSNVTARGPKLNDAAAKTEFAMGRFGVVLCVSSCNIFSS